MNNKIESLTEEQEKLLVHFRDEWLQIGLSAERTNRDLAESTLAKMYSAIDESRPYFWHCESPMMAQLVQNGLHENSLGEDLEQKIWDNLGDNLWANLRANLGANLRANLRANLGDNLRANLRANLGDNLRANLVGNLRANLRGNLWANLWANLRGNLGGNLGANLHDNLRGNDLQYYGTNLWGSLDSYWIAYYLFPQTLRKIHTDEQMERLNLWGNLAKSCFWIYSYRNICFVCDRPTEIHRDENGLLHNETGKAVLFSDGTGVTTWRGINIPDEWVETPPAADKILTWENVEQRRAGCELVGWHNVLDQLNAKVIDKHQNPQVGVLLEVDLPDSGKERFLKVKCGTGRDFAIPVPPEMKTAIEGQAWMNHETITDFILPAMRT